MLKRELPSGYGRSEGRLIRYSVSLEPRAVGGTGAWNFQIDKEYLPWERWREIARAGLDDYGQETHAVDDILARLEAEQPARNDSWEVTAYLHPFHTFAPGARDIFEREAMPLLIDGTGYFWSSLVGMLVEMTRAEGLSYPELADPGYFARHLDAAQTIWGCLAGIAHVFAAKWELALGACRTDPDPNDLLHPPSGEAQEIGGWYVRHVGADDTVEGLVERYPREFPPAHSLRSIQTLAHVYGARAAELVFGHVWAARWGYDALLADFERAVATEDEILRLSWLFPQRLRR